MKSLINIPSLTVEEIDEILKVASEYELNYVSEEYKQKKILLAFFEASTRTKLSFEIAAKNIGCQVIDFDPDVSSLLKGETLFDTLRTLEVMGINGIVIRHELENTSKEMSEKLSIPIINAGDGTNQHPTQALLDALTLKEVFGELNDFKITICGDIEHSRVARSNIDLLSKYDVDVALCGPEYLISDEFSNFKQYSNIDEAVNNSDVIMSLRIQKERIEKSEVPDDSKYFKKFGFKKSHFENNPNIMLMHPGPVNYGIEVENGLQSHERCLIDRQVSNGVLVRMAILKKILGK